MAKKTTSRRAKKSTSSSKTTKRQTGVRTIGNPKTVQKIKKSQKPKKTGMRSRRLKVVL